MCKSAEPIPPFSVHGAKSALFMPKKCKNMDEKIF